VKINHFSEKEGIGNTFKSKEKHWQCLQVKITGIGNYFGSKGSYCKCLQVKRKALPMPLIRYLA
jgi:hypothetical protein